MTHTVPFGPNQAAIEAFLQGLHAIPWFAHVGAPPDRPDADFVDFHFLAAHRQEPGAPWGSALVAAEAAIERLELSHGRISEHNAIQSAYENIRRHPSFGEDDLYLRLDDDFTDPATGYYRDTNLYPHELVEFPDRLVRGTALELMVADLDPNLTFFQSLMPWFELGRWPVGWRGTWPQGRIALW